MPISKILSDKVAFFHLRIDTATITKASKDRSTWNTGSRKSIFARPVFCEMIAATRTAAFAIMDAKINTLTAYDIFFRNLNASARSGTAKI